MTIYNAHFRTDADCASRKIKAATPELALAAARKIAARSRDELFFERYQRPFPINEIAIGNDDDSAELAVWFDDDLRLRLAADDLLNAARRVVERWESGDLAEAVRELSAAVAKAEGSAA
jgi:hypothetical protein